MSNNITKSDVSLEIGFVNNNICYGLYYNDLSTIHVIFNLLFYL